MSLKALFIATALGTFSATTALAQTNIRGTYSGADDCGTAKAFLRSTSHYLENITCSIELSLRPTEQSWSGDVYGDFDYLVEHRGQSQYRDSGRYMVSAQSGKIYFNPGSYRNPRPGVNYPFGTVYRSAIELATGARRGTILNEGMPGPGPGPGEPTNPGSGEECLSLSEAIELERCQNSGTSTLRCDILSVRYRRFGICQN